ncbi:hypothetical protein HK100_010495, partial [Physocladia obscura]
MVRALRGEKEGGRGRERDGAREAGAGKEKANAEKDTDARVQLALSRLLNSKLNYERLNSDLLIREADSLTQRQKIAPIPSPDPLIQSKESALIACYKQNSSRSLDCWKEVEDLKLAFAKAQK